MNILYPIIDGEITGGNIICHKIIEEALRRGHKVFVISSTRGKFTDILEEKGIQVYFLGLKRVFYFHRVFKLAGIIKREEIGLVHTHCSVAANILSRLAAKLVGVPVISHIHIENYFRNNLVIRHCQVFLDNWTSRLNKKIIAVSHSVKNSLIKQGIAANKIEVIYNGIDIQDFQPRRSKQEIYREFSLKENGRIIGIIGRLSSAKGQKELILAAKIVLKHYPDIYFMIVGEDLEYAGRYKKELLRLTQDLGISDRVIFTGFQEDIPSIMNAFELFCLPSCAEGLPMVILEAMALKKPVVATPVAGIPELIQDGLTGMFVPIGNIDSLAAAILFLLNNPDVARKIGESAYENVKQHFSLEKMLNRIMQIYEQLPKAR